MKWVAGAMKVEPQTRSDVAAPTMKEGGTAKRMSSQDYATTTPATEQYPTDVSVQKKKKKGLGFLRLSLSSRHRSRRLSESSTAPIESSIDSRRGHPLPSPIKNNPPSPKKPSYDIPAAHAASVDAAISAMLDSVVNISDQWTFNSEKQGVRAYSKDEEYDSACASCARLHTLDSHTAIDYFASKAVLMVAGRDFVNLVHWRQLPDGSIVLVAVATSDPSKPSPSPGLVRGEIHVAGWTIAALGASHSKVSFLIKMDLKGNIPGYIQRKVALDQAFCMLHVQRAMQRRPPTPPFLTHDVAAPQTSPANDPQPTTQTPVVELACDPPASTATFNPIGHCASPWVAFGTFLTVLYGLPLVGIDDVVHDIVVWNTIACMTYVLWVTTTRHNTVSQEY
ncbi:hypothetical protein, variant [Aphanomyces astaci]|uniref:START domain-containing protein n=1 Tax=Aphanomyces astaci TaxID=112090 RepID=W4GX62_APHAT|nr:hypothetical protein, variant [Aphanomyces astaci]ETV83926.1 hypothetical protein, variant [Aphanomyces astaci]|eukprot:XP_009827356.1 hypothetical protein, variant [Aphanomyces astaci]